MATTTPIINPAHRDNLLTNGATHAHIRDHRDTASRHYRQIANATNGQDLADLPEHVRVARLDASDAWDVIAHADTAAGSLDHTCAQPAMQALDSAAKSAAAIIARAHKTVTGA